MCYTQAFLSVHSNGEYNSKEESGRAWAACNGLQELGPLGFPENRGGVYIIMVAVYPSLV